MEQPGPSGFVLGNMAVVSRTKKRGQSAIKKARKQRKAQQKRNEVPTTLTLGEYLSSPQLIARAVKRQRTEDPYFKPRGNKSKPGTNVENRLGAPFARGELSAVIDPATAQIVTYVNQGTGISAYPVPVNQPRRTYANVAGNRLRSAVLLPITMPLNAAGSALRSGRVESARQKRKRMVNLSVNNKFMREVGRLSKQFNRHSQQANNAKNTPLERPLRALALANRAEINRLVKEEANRLNAKVKANGDNVSRTAIMNAIKNSLIKMSPLMASLFRLT